jgi:FAD binding domain
MRQYTMISLPWICLALSSTSAFTITTITSTSNQRLVSISSQHAILQPTFGSKTTPFSSRGRNEFQTLGSTTRSAVAVNDNQEVVRYEALSLPARQGRPLRVAIAGGGVGGLTAALMMLKRGMDVTVYEKTAAFARFGGPIQFASNALSVLKEIDDTLFDRVMEKFTFTGTRTCGIKDGLRADGSFRMTNDSLDYLWNPDAPADWFVKFPLKVRFRGLARRPSITV